MFLKFETHCCLKRSYQYTCMFTWRQITGFKNMFCVACC